MLEWIISSSALIVVMSFLRLVLKGKISLRLQYALWAIVLVRLLLPVSIGSSSISIMSHIKQTSIYQEAAQAVTEIQVLSDIIRDSELSYDDAKLAGNGTLHRVEGYPFDSEKGNLHTYSYTDSLQVVGTRILRIIWICGTAAVGLCFVITNLYLTFSLRKNRKPLHINKCALPIYLSGSVDTPCLFGLLHPSIYLTSEAAKNETVMCHAVEHELTHYRHMDHIWAILRSMCLAVHWYNPLVWYAAILSRNDAELACDESTIRRLGENERAEYGRTLISLTCKKRPAPLNIATTMTGSNKSIKERISLIVKKPKMTVCTLAAVILAAAIAVSCTFTGAKNGKIQINSSEVMEAVSFSNSLIYAEGKESRTSFDLYRVAEGQGPDLFCHYSTWGHPNLRLKTLQLGEHSYLLVSYVSRYPDVSPLRYERFTDIYYLRNSGSPLFTLQIQGNYSLKDTNGDGVQEIIYRQTGHAFDPGVYAAGEDGWLYQIDADGNYIFDQFETVDKEINLNTWYGIRSAPALVRRHEGTDLWISENSYSIYQAQQEAPD